MSMTVQLPASLRDRLGALASRVRLLRGLRGLCVLVLVRALTAAVAIGTDWVVGGRLPIRVRGITLAVWSVLGILLAWAGYRSFTSRIDPANLAAAVEERHPDLGERLTSSVELCQNSDEGNGSPELIELLVRETEA